MKLRAFEANRILAVSSAGGHWDQLMLICDAFDDFEVVYANTMVGLAERSGLQAAYQVPDFNAYQPLRVLFGIVTIGRLVLEQRPAIVISTGAAPGLIALVVAKLSGAKTIWIDSVANSDRLSLSGRIAGHFVDLWLTQWEHLSTPKGPLFFGSVI